MENYVRVQSSGEILRSSMHIYRRHFGILVAAWLPFLLPSALLTLIQGQQGWHVAVSFLFSLLAYAPATILISQACLGLKPTVLGAYRRGFGATTARVILASAMLTLLSVVGWLLVVPGLLFTLWYPFVQVAVVLEQRPVVNAFKRSRSLGRGFYLRNAVLILLPSMVVGGIGGLVGVLSIWPINGTFRNVVLAVTDLIGGILAPICSIALVLIYYDLRARKEAYDSAKLTEDLRR